MINNVGVEAQTKGKLKQKSEMSFLKKKQPLSNIKPKESQKLIKQKSKLSKAKEVKADPYENYYDTSSETSTQKDPDFLKGKKLIKPKSAKSFETKAEKKVVSNLYKYTPSANFFIFEDKYKTIVESVDNPKKRKNNESFLKNEYKAFLEKTKIFNAELNEFKNTLYSEEFRKTLQDDKHIFMNKHFPESYDAENFYKYIYLINKKRSEDPQICELKHNDCVLSNQPKDGLS